MTSEPPPTARRRFAPRRLVAAILLCLGAYLALAYALAPFLWKHFEHQRAIANLAMTTSPRWAFQATP